MTGAVAATGTNLDFTFGYLNVSMQSVNSENGALGRYGNFTWDLAGNIIGGDNTFILTTEVEGWQVDGPGHVAILADGRQGIRTPDGNPFIDMEARGGEHAVLTHETYLAPGTYEISMNVNNRGGTNTGMDVAFNGELLGNVTASTGRHFEQQVFVVEVTEPTVSSLVLSGTGADDGYGLGVNGVSITPR